MIIEFFVNIIIGLLGFIFDLLPALPKLPSLKAPFEGFKIIVGKGLRLLGVFLDVTLFKPLVLVVLGLMMFKKVYLLVKFIMKKIKFN